MDSLFNRNDKNDDENVNMKCGRWKRERNNREKRWKKERWWWKDGNTREEEKIENENESNAYLLRRNLEVKERETQGVREEEEEEEGMKFDEKM